MISQKHHEHLIETLTSLSEIELDAVVKDLAPHIRMNKITHVITNHFEDEEKEELVSDLQSQVEELTKQVEDLEQERDDIQDDLDELKNKIKALV